MEQSALVSLRGAIIVHDDGVLSLRVARRKRGLSSLRSSSHSAAPTLPGHAGVSVRLVEAIPAVVPQTCRGRAVNLRVIRRMAASSSLQPSASSRA